MSINIFDREMIMNEWNYIPRVLGRAAGEVRSLVRFLATFCSLSSKR